MKEKKKTKENKKKEKSTSSLKTKEKKAKSTIDKAKISSAKVEKRESKEKQEKKTLLLFCPRCKRETDNVITGFIGQKIRRVRCEVCKSEHNYHRILALKKRMEEEKSIDSVEGKEQLMQQQCYRIWEDLMLGRDPNTARMYNIKEKYFENDLINHQLFGIGVVRRVLEDYKIEVVFKNSIKILAHNRFLPKK